MPSCRKPVLLSFIVCLAVAAAEKCDDENGGEVSPTPLPDLACEFVKDDSHPDGGRCNYYRCEPWSVGGNPEDAFCVRRCDRNPFPGCVMSPSTSLCCPEGHPSTFTPKRDESGRLFGFEKDGLIYVTQNQCQLSNEYRLPSWGAGFTMQWLVEEYGIKDPLASEIYRCAFRSSMRITDPASSCVSFRGTTEPCPDFCRQHGNEQGCGMVAVPADDGEQECVQDSVPE